MVVFVNCWSGIGMPVQTTSIYRARVGRCVAVGLPGRELIGSGGGVRRSAIMSRWHALPSTDVLLCWCIVVRWCVRLGFCCLIVHVVWETPGCGTVLCLCCCSMLLHMFIHLCVGTVQHETEALL